MNKIAFAVLISLFFLLPDFLFGQQYTFHYLGQAKDLQYTRSRNIVKDKQGYIWIASDNGIIRFDGNNFLTFSSGAMADVHIPANNINKVFLLKNGNLAMVEDHARIGILNPNNFQYSQLNLKPYTVHHNQQVEAFQFDDGILYICIQSSNGIYILSYDGVKQKLIYKNGKKTTNVKKLISNFQNSVYITPYDSLKYLLFEASKGYFFLNKKTHHLTPVNLPEELAKHNPWPSFMIHDKMGHWLISFDDVSGMYTFDNHQKIVPDSHFSNKFQYRDVNYSKNGLLILSAYNDSSENFMVYNPEKQNVRRLKGIRFNSWETTQAWSENPNNYLYITGDQGLIYAKSSSFDIQSFLLDEPKNTLGKSIRGMLSLGNDKVLITTERSGLFLFNDKTGKVSPLKTPESWPRDLKPPRFVRNILKDRNGKIYFSAHDNVPKNKIPGSYLITYDKKKGLESYEHFPFRIENLVWQSDTSMLAAVQGRLYRIGLVPNIHYIRINLGNAVRDSSAFFVEKMIRWKKVFYFASNQGLFTYNPLKKDGLNKVDLPVTTTRHYLDLYADSKGVIWIGTEGAGLFSYNPETKTFKDFDKKNGISSGVVCGIIPEDSSRLWISTYNGLFLFNKKLGFARSMGDKSGFPKDEFNRYSYLALSKKSWLFGTMNGFIRVRKIKNNIHPDSSEILFSSATYAVKGESKDTVIYSLPQKHELILPPSDRNIKISFGVLEPRSSGVPPLYYKLTPLQNQWHKLYNHELVLNYLPSGNYHLEVSSDKNMKGKGIFKMNFKAAYFLYELWWFRVLVVIFIIAIISLLIFLYFGRKLAMEKARQIKENESFRHRLLTYIVHEFKTPLTVITGVSKKMKPGSEEALEQNIERIRLQSEQMNDLVEQMLELHQMDSGTWKPELKLVDIPIFVGRLCSQLQSLAEEMEIRLICSSSVQKSMQFTDISKLRSILNNLITNALKYSPEKGEVSLFFDVTDSAWSISVRDQGQGISKGDVAHIFELFYKGKESMEKRMSHSGVGLAYVKTAVEALEGRMEVYNESGAVFKMIFPVIHNDLQSVVGDSELLPEEKETEVWNGNGHVAILLVEDSEEIADYVRSCFDDTKFNVSRMKNGREGFAWATEQIPDLVITDARMPEMNGFELIHKLKKNELTNHIPIIMLTALSSETNRLKGLEAGADAYIPKPFNEKELLLTVDNILSTIQKQKKLIAAKLTGQNSIWSESSEEPVSELSDGFIDKVEKCLAENYTDNRFRMSDLAEHLNMSRAQMNRKIKSVIGLNPSDMLKVYRLNRAKELLPDKSISISEVAYACGFNNSSYFSKTFHKEFGESPTDYRERLF